MSKKFKEALSNGTGFIQILKENEDLKIIKPVRLIDLAALEYVHYYSSCPGLNSIDIAERCYQKNTKDYYD